MQYSFIALFLGLWPEVNASPYPGGVTSKVAPAALAPSGCHRSHIATFGIAVHPLVPKYKRAAIDPVWEIADGQPQAPGPVWQIGDGQPQAPITTTLNMAPVTQIGDGQLQVPIATTLAMVPVTQICDGQIQAPPLVTQIGDGQVQAPTSVPNTVVTQIGNGQIQAPTNLPSVATGNIESASIINLPPVTKTKNRQTQASTKTRIVTSTRRTKTIKSTSISSTTSTVLRPSSPAGITGQEALACKTKGTLELTLTDGVLIDSSGRTGYIASNRQFQFDAPPQSGAIFTAGFSTCNNGSLALGRSTVWWQCSSGDFYNLYDRNWAPQCQPISLAMVKLVDC